MSLPRRTFLRGVGATVALPLLEAMVPAFTALGADGGAAAHALRRRLRAQRRHHGTVDADRRRAGLRVLADPEAARAVPRFAGRRQQPDPRAARRVGGDHAVSAAGWLTGVARSGPKPKTSSRGITIDQVVAGQIGQDTPFPSLELATEDFTGYIGACTTRLQLRLREHDLVELADDAAADGDQPARGVRAAVRRAGHRGAARRAPAARTQHPRLRHAGGQRAAAARSARATARGSTVSRQHPRDRAAHPARRGAQQRRGDGRRRADRRPGSRSKSTWG